MPPKRKDSANAPGPKQKRSKPSFRTPTTAGLDSTVASEVGSTTSTSTSRVITLRANATSGRRGYSTQILSTTSTSSLNSLLTENSALPSEICDSESIPPLILESDLQSGSSSNSNAKSRPKQKNTTTVRYH
jgi:hypothetical protein